MTASHPQFEPGDRGTTRRHHTLMISRRRFQVSWRNRQRATPLGPPCNAGEPHVSQFDTHPLHREDYRPNAEVDSGFGSRPMKTKNLPFMTCKSIETKPLTLLLTPRTRSRRTVDSTLHPRTGAAETERISTTRTLVERQKAIVAPLYIAHNRGAPRLKRFPFHSQEKYQPKTKRSLICIHASHVLFVTTAMSPQE
ncbi:hypothetical protein SAMN05444166_3583 [Singulisphaera sp. GP187]|nr:hypothetical protein SAMN05444166_3583 [Singulisphaera sp. GP187]